MEKNDLNVPAGEVKYPVEEKKYNVCVDPEDGELVLADNAVDPLYKVNEGEKFYVLYDADDAAVIEYIAGEPVGAVDPKNAEELVAEYFLCAYEFGWRMSLARQYDWDDTLIELWECKVENGELEYDVIDEWSKEDMLAVYYKDALDHLWKGQEVAVDMEFDPDDCWVFSIPQEGVLEINDGSEWRRRAYIYHYGTCMLEELFYQAIDMYKEIL